jgi:gastrin-releasing peptide receptor
MTALLASAVTSTTQSARNTEEGIHQRPLAQQVREFASNHTAASKHTSDTTTQLNAVDTDLQQNVSGNYATYLTEQTDPQDEAALTATNVQGVQVLVANETEVTTNMTIQHLLDKVEKPKSLLLLLRPLNNFTKYTVQTETSNNTRNVLVVTAGSSSLSIVLISLNENANAAQQAETLPDNFNITFSTLRGKNHTLLQTNVLLQINTTSTDIAHQPVVSWRKTKEYHVLTHYIDPIMYSLILAVGLLGNGMLLFIFIRHRKLRTAANIMIIHLAICDIINLSVNGPLHFYFNYDSGSSESLITCRTVLAIRQFLRCTGALAVITLIIQRFIIIAPPFNKLPPNHRTSFVFAISSIVTVWVLPLLIALPTMYVPKFYEPICLHKTDSGLQYVLVLNLALYCVIMPSLMFLFSTLIARRLKQSVRNIPGEIRHQMQEESRIRSARMMMALAAVFVITYFPFHVWILLAHGFGVDRNTPTMVYALHFTKQLLFANGCFNPIAMFVVSSTFRMLLSRHVTYSSERGVYDTRL